MSDSIDPWKAPLELLGWAQVEVSGLYKVVDRNAHTIAYFVERKQAQEFIDLVTDHLDTVRQLEEGTF